MLAYPLLAAFSRIKSKVLHMTGLWEWRGRWTDGDWSLKNKKIDLSLLFSLDFPQSPSAFLSISSQVNPLWFAELESIPHVYEPKTLSQEHHLHYTKHWRNWNVIRLSIAFNILIQSEEKKRKTLGGDVKWIYFKVRCCPNSSHLCKIK